MARRIVNRYKTVCAFCGGPVAPGAGYVRKRGRVWVGAHLACADSGAPEVVVTTFSSGESVIRNRNGRCEDAPCCGCCTY